MSLDVKTHLEADVIGKSSTQVCGRLYCLLHEQKIPAISIKPPYYAIGNPLSVELKKFDEMVR